MPTRQPAGHNDTAGEYGRYRSTVKGAKPLDRSATLLLGGCLSSDLFRTNKHREIERGGAIAQEIYFYQTDDVAEYVLLMKTLPDLCVFFFFCGIVSLL